MRTKIVSALSILFFIVSVVVPWVAFAQAVKPTPMPLMGTLVVESKMRVPEALVHIKGPECPRGAICPQLAERTLKGIPNKAQLAVGKYTVSVTIHGKQCRVDGVAEKKIQIYPREVTKVHAMCFKEPIVVR